MRLLSHDIAAFKKDAVNSFSLALTHVLSRGSEKSKIVPQVEQSRVWLETSGDQK